MSQDKISIKVNEVELEARPGEMIIEATDRAGVYIPRFCYHPKLSIAANCRMCLVEVIKAPKPLPACATPVAPGMEIYTRSANAIAAQKATMEFLLINHPLDCPICDQGGECELQDLAMGFGRDISRFNERKRIVRDKNIGPLISTDMTRCIHCTRCVRFGSEIAGIQELGTIGRGDRMEISTYIEQSVDHELSGNIIDLCPVGALNSKPYRFSARAWEMTARSTIAPHDCLGSHISAHVLNGRIKRVVPAPFEPINETWLSDRDRFSYEGINAPDRLLTPMLREAGKWRPVDWETALSHAAAVLKGVAGKHGAGALGAWVSPGATLEEGYLLQSFLRKLGSANIDYRLRQQDFRNAAAQAQTPLLGTAIADIERQETILLIGSQIRHEVPLLAHRVRKAALRGAQVMFINPEQHELLFPVSEYRQSGQALVEELQAVVKAAAGDRPLPAGIDWASVSVEAAHEGMADALSRQLHAVILLGHVALQHARYAELQALADTLAEFTGATVGVISEGPNAAGLALAGVLPHRGPGGAASDQPGLDYAAMLENTPRALLLWNVEPDQDCLPAQRAVSAVQRADFVIACSPWLGDALRESADLVLPIATFAETAGTFVNAEGLWQSFSGVARPVGESRPGWKVLRVLGNLLDLPGFDYVDATEISATLQAEIGSVSPNRAAIDWAALATAVTAGEVCPPTPMYRTDALVRRAPALQLAGAHTGMPGEAPQRQSA